MTAGTRIRIKRYPHLVGNVKLGSHHVTYKDFFGTGEDFTPPEPRVQIEWDPTLGPPAHTTIMERFLEVVDE